VEKNPKVAGVWSEQVKHDHLKWGVYCYRQHKYMFASLRFPKKMKYIPIKPSTIYL